jgi:hexosaminidase
VLIGKGEYALPQDLRIFWSGEGAQPEAQHLADWLGTYLGNPVSLHKADPGQEPRDCIVLRLEPEVDPAGGPAAEPAGGFAVRADNPANASGGEAGGPAAAPTPGQESYRLIIAADGIEIRAAAAAGLFYGTQTLRQLLDDFKIRREANFNNYRVPNEPNPYWARWHLPVCTVLDTPAFEWRGLLLDASRHFWTPAQVKRVIDQLAYHKMNVLHWHLTDDQGWRLALDAYPELAEQAAWRTEADGSRYGGFYTADQVRDIVAYAGARHVRVVPEIEMPGHSQAALSAYPALSCTGGPHKVWNDWGVSKEIFCAGNEASFRFLDGVLQAVTDLFDSEFIHLGGDEAPTTRWEACPKCQARQTALGLDDSHALQSWFLRRVADSLALEGRRVLGWDETGEGPLLHPTAVVQVWRGMEHAEAALKAGRQIVVSPTSHAYFDYGLESIDLKQVYGFNPVPEAYRGKPEQALVLGGAANLWSEHVPDQAALDDRLFPRLLAMAEVLWSGPQTRSWQAFHADVQQHYSRLDRLGVAYGAETVPLAFVSVANPGGWVDLRLVPGAADAVIYFGQGRYVPDTASAVFDTDTAAGAHLSLLDGETTISARAYRRGRPWGEAQTRQFSIHQATGRPVALAQPWTEPYNGGGAGALTDGRLGTEHFRDGIWQGFFGQDLDATLDLGQVQTVDSVLLGAYQYINAWIFLPTRIQVFTAVKPGEWTLAATGNYPPSPGDSPDKRKRMFRTFVSSFEAREVRYIRVVAENFGVCPPWHEAAGSPTWLFADEIAVR